MKHTINNNLLVTFISKRKSMILKSLVFLLTISMMTQGLYSRGKDSDRFGRFDMGFKGSKKGYMGMFGFDLREDGEISKDAIEGRQDKIFKDFDKNDDKKVSKDEFIEVKMKKIKILAEVSYREINASREKDIKADLVDGFGELDDDDNGSLSKEELLHTEKMQKWFDKIDENKDGKIDRSEFRDSKKKWSDRKGHRKKGKGYW